jgi:predicted AAA+ superfamily ATPase
VIDEVQKIDNWSEVIKQQWIEIREKTFKLILLGSLRLLIQKGLTESLAGRFATIYMTHWSFAEMETAFGWDVNRYLFFGGYPGTAHLIDDVNRWKTYINESLIETSLSKDILMLMRIDKSALLKSLFEIGVHYSGQILSYTKIIGQLQDAGNSTTLANYLRLLSECGLHGGLEKYAGEIIRQKSSSPKFQVYNTALPNAKSNETCTETMLNPKLLGRLVESAVGAHLLNHTITEKYSLYTKWILFLKKAIP